MTITTEETALVLHLKKTKDLTLTQPYIWKVIEPAWDAKTIYLPTYLGLYSVSRATGEKTWLAHQTNTPAYSALLLDDSLYLITSRGLFRYTLPK